MNHQRLKIGFIGCGGVANHHYNAILKCSNAELLAVSDINTKYGKARAKEWGAAFYSPEQLLSSPDIDAVFVLTPMEYHYSYAKKALEEGKHVLVEKPVSSNIGEIQHLAQLSNQTGKVCMPGHSYLYLPELSRMKRLIAEGQIGIPTSMFMSEIYLMPEALVERYHGPMTEVLCHQAYLALSFLGIPHKIHAFTSCFRDSLFPDQDEQVTVNMKMSNGSTAHLFVSWAGHDETSDPWTFKLKVLGTQGGLHFSRRDAVHGSLTEQREYPLYDEMFELEVDYFINKCIFLGKEPLSTMEDAAMAMQMIKAIRTSANEDKVEMFSS
jgi:predicted dehydrogenase